MSAETDQAGAAGSSARVAAAETRAGAVRADLFWRSRRARSEMRRRITWLVFGLRLLQPGMLLLATAVIVFFVGVGASHEVFMAASEAYASGQSSLIWAYVTIAVMSAAFNQAQAYFSRPHPRMYDGQVPAWYARPSVMGARRLVAVGFVYAPWAAASAGFERAATGFEQLASGARGAAERFGVDPGAYPAALGGDPSWPERLTEAAAAANTHMVFFALAGVFWTAFIVAPTISDRAKTGRTVYQKTATAAQFGVAMGVFVVLAVAPLIAPQWFFAFITGVDPVTPGALATLFVLGFFVVVGWMARASGVNGGVVFALVILAAVLIQAGPASVAEWLDRRSGDPAARTSAPAAPCGPDDRANAQACFEARFAAWLAARPQRPNAAPQPVFILAARGGGAYAAVAAASLLSGLDAAAPAGAPRFTDNLFALVGVSGGAVGAAVDGLLRGADGSGGARKAAVLTALTSGHIAPIMGLLGSDVTRKFLPAGASAGAFTRDVGLHFSLAEAIDAQAGSEGASATRFDAMSADPTRTMLVFMTTSSETGARVAHAPVALREIGDGTLRSFSEFRYPNAAHPHPDGVDAAELAQETVLGAALASARFPLVVPAYVRRSASDAGARYNFVDGGFSDSTGATTALEIYEALVALRAERADLPPFEPYLIVINDQPPDADAAPQYGGTVLSDIGATVGAVLNIRSLLSRQSIRRVRAAFVAAGRPDNLLEFTIDRGEVDLPLGWRLSRATAELLAAQMGDPVLAEAAPATGGATAALRNSCVAHRVARLLSGGGAPPAACAGFAGHSASSERPAIESASASYP